MRRTNDVDTIRRLWPHIEAALRWMEQYGDLDGDGFIEYRRRTPEGLLNQGWKDSQDSISHEDGTLANGPIALVEVQAYAYGAWRAASEMAAKIGEADNAADYKKKADALRTGFDKAFFDAELGSYVLALDGEKKPCRVQTSNAGHALFTGIALPERAHSVVRALMHTSMFSGWGIRTLSSAEKRFNPMSYHNGSIWPHDNALIAAGFARYGFRREAGAVFTGLYQASTYLDLRRLPELFCGFSRQRTQGPISYPVACSPQAWAAAALISLLQSSIGLSFDPARGRISFERPWLPDFLDRVTLRNLATSGARADIELRRSEAQVLVEVLYRTESMSVATTV
jgi:glycogen debranching enzyme